MKVNFNISLLHHIKFYKVALNIAKRIMCSTNLHILISRLKLCKERIYDTILKLISRSQFKNVYETNANIKLK